MKPLILSLFLLSITVSGWACESYDECMKSVKERKFDIGYYSLSERDATIAIAYKLDEISKLMKENK